MLSLYEILKASKTGIAPDMWTALAGKNWGGADSGHEVKELTGTPPLSFRADGTPLLDYTIYGNMEQTGTPTPDNPIMPQGCGERTGNLAYGRIDGVNIDANGTIGILSGFDIAIGRVESGVTYTANTYVFAFYTNEPTIGSASYDGSRIVGTVGTPSTFTAPITGYVAFRLNPGEQAMLNTGSTAKPFEPNGYKIPISSGGVTTNIYLGSTQTVRQIKKYEFTGQEDWSISNNERVLYTALADHLTSNELICYCSHYKSIANISAMSTLSNGECSFNNTLRWFYIKDNDYNDKTSFKTYLTQQYNNGTPVTIWYVLATETTGIVNEPLRKIGDYADTLSYEQAQVSIPTNRGNTVIDVLTELKPSEMYIKYKG